MTLGISSGHGCKSGEQQQQNVGGQRVGENRGSALDHLRNTFVSYSLEEKVIRPSGTDTEFCIPDHWVQAAVMVKIRTFKLNPDLFRTTF